MRTVHTSCGGDCRPVAAGGGRRSAGARRAALHHRTSQRVTVQVLDKDRLVRKEMRWGFPPPWSKQLLINAHSETVHRKAVFKQAYATRRCLIPADGFYEWQTQAGRKTPVRFVLKSGAPFYFSGLWEPWVMPAAPEDLFPNDFPDAPPASRIIESAFILTAAPNDTVSPVHNRMPVILNEEPHDWWFDGGYLARLALNYPRNSQLEWYPVSPLVNDAQRDEVRCIARTVQPRGPDSGSEDGR